MKKRLLTALLAAVMVLVSFAGCSAPQAESPAASEPAASASEPAASASESAPASDVTGSSLEEAYASVQGEATVSLADLPEATAKEPYKIGAAMTVVSTGWFKALYDNLEKTLKDAGCDVIIVECEDDVTKQVSQIETLIAQKVDAIIINPANPQEALSTVLNQAYEAGIPVVAVDVPPADDAPYLAACVTDAYQLGYLVGEELATRLLDMYPEGEIPYGLIGGTDGNSIAAARNEGARAAIKDVDTEGRIVEKAFLYAGAYSEESGLETAQNMLTANQDLKCIIGTCDAHIVGATRAAEALGLSEKLIMGAVDGSKAACEIMMNDGPIVVLGLNNPVEVGEVAARTILGYLNDGTLPIGKKLVMEPSKVTPDNVKDYYNPDAAW